MASDEVGVGDLKVRPTRSNSFPSVVVYLSSEEDRFVRRDKDVRVKQEQVGRCLVRFGVSRLEGKRFVRLMRNWRNLKNKFFHSNWNYELNVSRDLPTPTWIKERRS